MEEMGTRERVKYLWRHYIPQKAMKHVFLMHGLLALAALHLAYLNPDSSIRYLQMCDKHQAIALKKFRTILSTDINPELADSLFALAATMSISSVARSCAIVEARTIDIDDVVELFFLTRGVRDVILVTYEHITSGPMLEMFENSEYPAGTEVSLYVSCLREDFKDSQLADAIFRPQPVSDQFNSVRTFLKEYGLDPEALTHCESALNDLEEIYRNVQYFGHYKPIETGQVWRWKTMVTTGFVRLIAARCPPALVILAYYAASNTALRTAWYAQNWGEYVIRGISRELEPGMQYWLAWPTKQVEERMSSLGVRIFDNTKIDDTMTDAN